MACINSDGTPAPSAKQILDLLQEEALTPPVIAAKLERPLFRVRSSLRELQKANLVTQQGEGFIAAK